jgi:hypothetical protein
MTKRTAVILGTVVLGILLAAFTGSALAGNGNGKNGNSQATASPGNSGDAPGHNKDTESAASANQSSPSTGSASQNSASTPGMKPTNATSKNTTCSTGGGGGSGVTCAPSSSNQAATQVGTRDASKRYGNGATAAQIATTNGAPSGTTIYGPGNSQPHKVQACGKANGHWVDVHAVKQYSGAKCATSTGTQTQMMTTQNGSTSVTGSTVVHGKAEAKGLSVASANGGFLGVTASAGKSGNTPAGGVLGALTTVGSGTLPFTGFPLWVTALLAVALIGAGLTLRRFGRATA